MSPIISKGGIFAADLATNPVYLENEETSSLNRSRLSKLIKLDRQAAFISRRKDNLLKAFLICVLADLSIISFMLYVACFLKNVYAIVVFSVFLLLPAVITTILNALWLTWQIIQLQPLEHKTKALISSDPNCKKLTEVFSLYQKRESRVHVTRYYDDLCLPERSISNGTGIRV